MIVTIIGSRETPANILETLVNIAAKLMANGHTVRSGAAGGADETVNTAYHRNARNGIQQTEPEIFVPWYGFGKEIQGSLKYQIQGSNTEAAKIAEQIHPAWERCSQGAQKLHTRNVCQILGADIKTPSDVVLYWCKEQFGKPTGGTATAVNLASKHKVTTINMLHSNWTELLDVKLKA